MCSIYMETFTWQVVATFTAALAAAIVGWRQVGIAASQRDIAKAQADTASAAFKIAAAQAFTAKLSQRSALFERRFSVFESVQGYLRWNMAKNSTDNIDLEKEVQSALNKARFLFPEVVNKKIVGSLQLADEVASLYDKVGIDRSQKNRESLIAKRAELREAVKDLSVSMGLEMVLHFNEDQ